MDHSHDVLLNVIIKDSVLIIKFFNHTLSSFALTQPSAKKTVHRAIVNVRTLAAPFDNKQSAA